MIKLQKCVFSIVQEFSFLPGFSLALSLDGKASCHVVRCSRERPTCQRTKGGLQPTTHEDLRCQFNLANNYIGKVGSGFFSIEPVDECNLERNLKTEDPVKSCSHS